MKKLAQTCLRQKEGHFNKKIINVYVLIYEHQILMFNDDLILHNVNCNKFDVMNSY